MTKRILLVVTNVGHYETDPSHPTGLWLSELTHAWDVFAEAGFNQTIVSPLGGRSPLEPRSLKFPNYDKTAKDWHEDPARMALLDATLARVDRLVPHDVEARIQERGAKYSKALLPFVSNTVVDGNLVTGQNPGSAKATAKDVVTALTAR